MATTTEDLYRNVLGREASQEEINSWGFGESVDAGELDSFLGAARNEVTTTMPKTGAVGTLAQQILAQGTSGDWGGEGYGSAEKNAYDMAALLAAQGITDINQFGVRDKTVTSEKRYNDQGDLEDGVTSMVPEYYNKATGEAVGSYYDKAKGSTWSGTFAGDDSTAYNVQFKPDGTPVFYSQYGGSSNDLAQMLDDPILSAVANIAASYFGGPLGSAALQAAQGRDLKDIAAAAALTYAGGQVGGNIAGNSDVVNALGQTGAKIAGNVGAAVATGRDPLQALITGGVGAAMPEITSTIPGYGDLNAAGKSFVNNVIASTLRNGSIDENSLIAAATSAGSIAVKDALSSGSKSSDFERNSFGYDQAFDPNTAGMVDLSEKPYDPNYKFTTDFGVGADYGLGPKSDGQGFQITAPPEVFNKDGSVNYDLLDYDRLSSLGMDMPKSPNLDGMGGGQGLRIPVKGGYITEQGFIPESYTPTLGDPNSFINKPAPDGQSKAATSKGPAAPSNKGVDLNALMSLLGGGQQAPTVVSSGQENSADIELMQDIFGTDLSAPLAGNIDTRESQIARLLRI
jgi:hypothetical protein